MLYYVLHQDNINSMPCYKQRKTNSTNYRKIVNIVTILMIIHKTTATILIKIKKLLNCMIK